MRINRLVRLSRRCENVLGLSRRFYRIKLRKVFGGYRGGAAAGAKSLELRATVSVGRLWHSQESAGKREEARQMLAEIYGWFTEGFDTVDLKEAKALL